MLLVRPGSHDVSMGTDINLVVETRHPNGAWALTPSTTGSMEDWYEDRNYECFTLLTGLDFSNRHLRPSTPVAELRGWPTDASQAALQLLDSCGDDTTYGRSWLSSADFQAYDWDASVDWSYMTRPQAGSKFSAEDRSAIEAHVRQHGRPPQGWTIAGWSRGGFPVVGSITRRRLAQQFLEKVVNPLQVLSGSDAESARCIFSFVR